MYTVVINAGPLTAEDNIQLYCNEVHVEVEYLNDEERPHESVKWAVFVPNNGHQRGQLCKVPFERVVMVSEDERPS